MWCDKEFKEGTGVLDSYSNKEYFCSEECDDHFHLISDKEISLEEEIVCPYCGYEHSDSFEAEDEDDDFECSRCGRVFSVYREYHDVTYTSTPHLKELLKMKAEETDEDGEMHNGRHIRDFRINHNMTPRRNDVAIWVCRFII